MYAITHAAPAAPRAPSPVPRPERAGARPVPVELFNAPSPRDADDGSRGLMKAIEVGDAALRRHMAMPPGTVLPCAGSESPATPVQALVRDLDGNVPERSRIARDLIAALEPMRKQLGRRAAEDLQRWLDERAALFIPNPERLKRQVLHAGLGYVLCRLPMTELPYAKRLRIGEVLHRAGGHPGNLRGWLGLEATELQDNYNTALLDLMLPREAQGSLGFERPRSLAMREERAHVWQWVAMVNRRFGHRDNQLAALDPSVPRRNRRVRQLQNLANAPEAQRKGIKVQLP